MTSPLAVTDLHSTPRRISLDKLQEPGVYALVSWGIAEKIRLYRARAGCRISQLADACRLDPSHVSRIENAEANPSLDSLVRIARFLRIGLEELIAPLPWVYKTVDIQQSKKITKPNHQPVSVQPVDPTHQLHPSLLEIPGGQAVSLPPKNLSQISRIEPICISSCIVLEGRAIFEPPDGADAELLESGCVLHFWRAVEGRFQALQDTRILQIICANSCTCGAEENEKL
jgi:transcriptional regulator with XRE-family HTH domain